MSGLISSDDNEQWPLRLTATLLSCYRLSRFRMRYFAVVLVSLLLPVPSEAGRAEKPEFVGMDRCKLCHRAIVQSWSKTAHRRASDTLGPTERSARCLECHSTGSGAFPGVQCEACHGAGGNYWPAEVMLDPEKAREAGLIEPKESVCRSCHGSGLPNHPSRFSMPEEAKKTEAIH